MAKVKKKAKPPETWRARMRREPKIPNDRTFEVQLETPRAETPFVHVCTYKSSILMEAPNGLRVWMRTRDAERLAKQLLAVIAHRRKIDAAQKAHEEWEKS